MAFVIMALLIAGLLGLSGMAAEAAAEAAAATELPIVDLAKLDWKERAIEALQSHASFYLVNHGLGDSSHGLVGAAFNASARLFALKEEAKRAVDAGPPPADFPVVRGYFAVGAESGTRKSRFECKEGISLAGSRRSAERRPNQLPKGLHAADVKALEAFPEALKELARRLADGMAEVAQSRQLLSPEDAAFFGGGGDGLEAFRIFRYLPYEGTRCEGRAPADAELLWSSDHTDWGSLTLIAQPDEGQGGLELYDEGGYHRITPRAGALVVNGGDWLELVSRGALPSPLHRVRQPFGDDTGRTAFVYFHYPAASAPLRPRDVAQATDRRARAARPAGFVFNTLTNGLEHLDEAITFKSHLQQKWLGVRASKSPSAEL
mmetsp:Transcript_8787/g.20309  ORF Transcript_8787/g.20309 Transcript_8787/m.20309 type:complete len:377 (+) Transcript_8787:23-1153(+)